MNYKNIWSNNISLPVLVEKVLQTDCFHVSASIHWHKSFGEHRMDMQSFLAAVVSTVYVYTEIINNST